MVNIDSIFEELAEDVKVEAQEELDSLLMDEELPETPFQNTLLIFGCRATGNAAIKWYDRYFSLFPGITRHRVVVEQDAINEITKLSGINNDFDLCVQFDVFLGSINETESFLDILKIVIKTVYFNGIFIDRLGRKGLKFIKLYDYLKGTNKLISSELSNRLIERQIRITDYNDSSIAETAIKTILRKSLKVTDIEKKFSGGFLFEDLYINDKLDNSLRELMFFYEVPFTTYSSADFSSVIDFSRYVYLNDDKEKIDELFFGSQTLRIKRGCILEACAHHEDFCYYLCLEFKEIIVDYELVKRFVVFKLPHEIYRLDYYLMMILGGSISNVRRIINEAELEFDRKSFVFRDELIRGLDKPYVFRG